MEKNEIVEFDGVKFEKVKIKSSRCDGCYFHHTKKGDCKAARNVNTMCVTDDGCWIYKKVK